MIMVLGTLAMKVSLAFLDFSKLDFANETGFGTFSRKYFSSAFRSAAFKDLGSFSNAATTPSGILEPPSKVTSVFSA